MRYVLIHFHIFKNAGTTVEYILDRSFGEHWTRFDGPDRNCILATKDLLSFLKENPGILALSSHQLRYPKPVAEGYVFFDLLFLRDPVDRVYSIYKFFRREPDSDDPLSFLAKTRDLGSFVAEMVEKYPHYINDAQVNLLCNGGDYTRPPGDRDLEGATNVLLSASAPGVVDCFNESWIAAQYFLSPVFPTLDCRYVPQNASAEHNTTLEERLKHVRHACGKRLYAGLLALTKLDDELVKRARAEVSRRLRLVPKQEQRLEELENELKLLVEEGNRPASLSSAS